MRPASTPTERTAMIVGTRVEMPMLNLVATLRRHLAPVGWAKMARAAGVAFDFAARAWAPEGTS
jgi:hypothetical protein